MRTILGLKLVRIRSPLVALTLQAEPYLSILSLMNNQSNQTKIVLGISFLYLALAMIMGAFGAHALKDLLSDYQKDVFFKANFYHFVAALTLLFISNNNLNFSKKLLTIFFIGSIVFSGSLYLLAITNLKWLGAVTPIGGSLMIVILIYIGTFCFIKKNPS